MSAVVSQFPGAALNGTQIVSVQTETENLILNGQKINKVSNDYKDSDLASLPSSKALYDAMYYLDGRINKIDPNHLAFRDNSVISLPLASLFFTPNDPTWQMHNWVAVNKQAVFIENGIDNKLSVPPKQFTQIGSYFLIINIDQLPSGNLTVVNEKDNVLFTIDNVGVYYFEVYVGDIDKSSVGIIANNVDNGNRIIINSIGIYKITERIRDYISYRLINYNEDIKKYIDNIDFENDKIIALLNKKVNDHIDDKRNPHNVTYDQTGAAKDVHEHQTSDIVDIEPYVDNKIDIHKDNKLNPHGVTFEQAGAAPAVHTHKFNDLEFDSDGEDTPGEETLPEKMVKHLGNKENPHEVTPFQIGAVSRDEIDAIVKDTAYPDMRGKAGYVLSTDSVNVLWVAIPNLPDPMNKDGYLLTVEAGRYVLRTKEDIGISGEILANYGNAAMSGEDYIVKMSPTGSGYIKVDGVGDYVLGEYTEEKSIIIDVNRDFVIGK